MVGRQFTPEEPTISTEQMKILMVGMLEDHLNRILTCFPFQRDPPSPSFSSDFQPLGGQKGKNATEVPEEGTVSAYAFDAPWQLVLGKDDGSSGDASKGWERFFLKPARYGGIPKAKNSWQYLNLYHVTRTYSAGLCSSVSSW